MNTQIALVHLHLDFERHLAELLRRWNAAQSSIEFVGVRPSRKLEHPLLTPGAISDDEASSIAARVRTEAGYCGDDGIIVFTEKRLFDNSYYQLFVGGREADQQPPRVAVLSLQYLRREYPRPESRYSRFFSAIVSNILFSVGVDVGLDEHRGPPHGCIMDFCGLMSEIEISLAQGPAFCGECRRILGSNGDVGPQVLVLPDVFKCTSDIGVVESDITTAILLRGEQYAADTVGFDYDVALSFSGSDRGYVELMADQLRSNGMRVFYDKAEQANLWGRNLQIHFGELYRLRARYCVVFVSENYVKSAWTKLGLEAALAREFERGDTYVLPIRLDDTQLREILPTRGYVDARRESVESIVDIVKRKLAKTC